MIEKLSYTQMNFTKRINPNCQTRLRFGCSCLETEQTKRKLRLEGVVDHADTLTSTEGLCRRCCA